MKQKIKGFFANQKNRVIALTLSLAMVLSFVPSFAFSAVAAAGNASGTVRTTTLDLTNNSYQTGATQNGTIWANDKEGWSYDTATKTLTLSGVNIRSADSTVTTYGIKLPNDATIVLAEGTTNIVRAGDTSSNYSSGIYSDGSITINGTGTLQATSGSNATDSWGILAGTITVNGGTVTATGGSATGYSCGILAGTITVNGGTVTATGGTAKSDSFGMWASRSIPAIGKPTGNSAIIVNGGTVTATGGTSGRNSYGIYAHSTIDINNGTITATSGSAATYKNSYGMYANSTITISGGTVTATGGIEIYYNSFGMYSGSTITINGGLVIARSAKSLESKALNTAAALGSGMALLTGSGSANFAVYGESGKYYVMDNKSGSKKDGMDGYAQITGETGLDYTGTAPADVSNHITWANNTLTLKNVIINVDTAGSFPNTYGINLPVGATITLEGANIVRAGDTTKSTYSCGIYSDGSVTINGTGIVALIGGTASYNSYGIIAGDEITVNGGTVTAIGGTASIESYGMVANGTINITDGTVTATGGTANSNSYGMSAGETINISGGTGTAIGGTADNYSSGMEADTINISGGTGTAIGGTANSLSHGMWAGFSITVNGGTVTATGGTAKSYSYGITVVSSSTISGGTVTATGGTAGSFSYGMWVSITINVSGGTGKAVSGTAATSQSMNKAPSFTNQIKFLSGNQDSQISTWGTLTCKILWHEGSGSEASSKLAQGSLITLPTAPTLKGSTFGGWWTEQDGKGTQINESTTVPFDDSVTYYAKWYSTPKLTGGTIRTSTLDLTNNSYQTGATQNGTVWTNDKEGWSYDTATKTLTLSGVNINSADSTDDTYGIHLPNDVTIVLAEGTTNIVRAGDTSSNYSYGIWGGNLTINGTGTLQATGGTADRQSCGINAGTITVSGGTVTVTGGTTNLTSYGMRASRSITVNGGTVTATGGTARNGSIGMNADFSSITINGGTVTTTGGTAGKQSYGMCMWTGSSITVNGGTVTATGGTSDDSYGICSDNASIIITITGGLVIARSGSGSTSNAMKTAATLGSGMALLTGSESANFAVYGESGKYYVMDNKSGSKKDGMDGYAQITGETGLDYTGTAPADVSNHITWANNTLTLKNVIINVDTAGISSDTYGIKLPDGATITLEGANIVRAGDTTSGDFSFGIYSDGSVTINGTGIVALIGGTAKSHSYGMYAHSTININGGTVTATGGTASTVSYGMVANDTININGGTVTTTGGTTNNNSLSMEAGTITVSGGSVTATGGTASYSSYGMNALYTVTVSGGSVTATGGTAGRNSYGMSVNSSITINGGTGTAIGGTSNKSGAFNKKPKFSNQCEITSGTWDGKFATWGVNKTPTIEQKPTASGITYGQTLASSALTGGNASVDGSFAWVTPTTVPNAGTAECEVIFTPTDNNYDSVTFKVSVTVATADGDITAVSDISKTYDGNAVSAPTFNNSGSGAATIKYKVKDADDSTYTEAAPKNAGNYTVLITVAADSNYKEASTTKDFIIGQKELTVSGIIASGKTYDGNTTAALTMPTITAAMGLVNGDSVTVTANGTFADKNVGTDKTVNITDLTLGGTSAANYKLAASTQQTATTASISQKELTVNVEVNSKNYDGLNTTTIKGTPTLNGVVSGDTVNLTNGTPTFASFDVANDIAVSFTNFTISGTDAKNYSLTQPTGIKANILIGFTPIKGTQYTVNSNDWQNNSFVISAKTGYELSITNTASGVWSNTLEISDETASGSATFYVKNSVGEISVAKTENYKIDKTAPTNVEISYGSSKFKEFLNNITFGLFFKDTVTVTLTSTDTLSEVKEFKYTLDGSEQTITATNNKATFNIEPQFKGQISNVIAIDNAQNKSAPVNSEYFAVDKNAPTAPSVDLNGYTSDKWTNNDVKFTLSDATADSGIAKYQYSTDNGASWVDMSVTEKTDATATTPFNATKAELTISADTNQVSYIFRAVSNADVNGTPSAATIVKIDKVAPTITANGDITTIKQSDKITVTPTAGISGIAKVEVQKDSEDYTDITATYASGYEVTANGTYTFKVTNGAEVTETASLTYESIGTKIPDTTTSSKADSPMTGETNNMALWIALLFVSGGVLTAVGITKKKRKVK